MEANKIMADSTTEKSHLKIPKIFYQKTRAHPKLNLADESLHCTNPPSKVEEDESEY